MSENLRYELRSSQHRWVVVHSHHPDVAITDPLEFAEASQRRDELNAAYVDNQLGNRDSGIEKLVARLNDDDPDRPVTYGQVYVAVELWLTDLVEQMKQELTWYLLDAPDNIQRAVDASQFDRFLARFQEDV